MVVKLVDLPYRVKGLTVRKNGHYTILLNARLTREANEKTLRHELAHIRRGDFDRIDHVQLIEAEVRRDVEV